MRNVYFKMWATGKYLYKAGYAVWLVVRKDRRRRIIATGIYAMPHQWDDRAEMLVTDRRIPDLHPDRVRLNIWLTQKKSEIFRIISDFENERTDWTLDQFEQAYLHLSAKRNVREYFLCLIDACKETGHIGNATCYERTLHILEVFDGSFARRVFPEIDIRYVKAFDIFLQKRRCRGNTRKFYFKVLRSAINKAIQDGEASRVTYPFGKGGFNVAALEEETAKRYLPKADMDKLKNTVVASRAQEIARRLFLFSYYCCGISFIDEALLTRKNIMRYEGGLYIVYKRTKTKEVKRVKPLRIRITDEIQELLDWFAANTELVEDYLLPVVSCTGYSGERLYKHIRCRYGRNNRNLSALAATLGITDIRLTSYCARHTMAMTLQDNNVPREIISQILGHRDLATTNVYLDSFSTSVIDEAVKVL
ncbi:MAG TPA: site-specific integrase [Candidatus Coprenecus stercoravium]|uniref:Site-specific integrase n=1 Tax=Candidatus Coprenecus stercoravium TaxID=2840735 RepID=A0A9D2GQM3_9BACT|nr:site-specific integrase [Candidatus Coprenecus stercoravium]